jgi:hydrogenase/urease accessory protein HupE
MAALGLVLAIAAPAAEAHVGVQTVALLAGAMHPWINLDSGLTLCALTLWMTQGARLTDVEPFLVSGACLAAGVAVGSWLAIPSPTALPYLLALAAGGCVSLDLAPRPPLRFVAVGLFALLAGYFAGADAAADVTAPELFACGALAGGLVIPLGVAALLAGRPSRWLRVALRIVGSWIAAIGLMVLALRLRS